jgi:hypothetical protein
LSNAIVALFFLVIMPSSTVKASQVPIAAVKVPSQESKKMTNTDFFCLNEEQRRSFIQKALAITLGETRQGVRSVLGDPWADDLVTSKEKRKTIGRFVTYYLRKHDKALVNERLDEWIVFKFGTDDRLKKIISKIPEIPSRP